MGGELIVHPGTLTDGWDLTPGGRTLAFHRKQTTLSVMILDASGSMQKYGDVPRQAVNAFALVLSQDQRAYHAYTLLTFNNELRLVIPFTPISKMRGLDSYDPFGDTCLYASVDLVLTELCRHWNSLDESVRRVTKVAVSVFSDGEDTRSPQPLYPAQVQQTSKTCRELGWTLYASGIGINGTRLAQDLGFDENLAQTQGATAEGLSAATSRVASHTTTGFWEPPKP